MLFECLCKKKNYIEQINASYLEPVHLNKISAQVIR